MPLIHDLNHPNGITLPLFERHRDHVMCERSAHEIDLLKIPRVFLCIAENFCFARLKDSASDSLRPGNGCSVRHRLVSDGLTEHQLFPLNISQEERAIFSIQEVECCAERLLD